MVHLKPQHIESERMMIRVEQGKGRKDRYTLLPQSLLDLLRQYWKACRPGPWMFDFIVTGKSKRLLEEHIKPALEGFLEDRGLSLSEEKTAITYIKKGFTFLGPTFRKHGRVLHITPSKEGVLALIRKVGTLIRTHFGAPMPALIKKLNEVLRGWANYHRHVMASEAFSLVDSYVFEQLWRMLRQRHQNKSKGWLIKKYWSATGLKHVFSVKAKTEKGREKIYQFLRVCSIGIRRHIKIKAAPSSFRSISTRLFC